MSERKALGALLGILRGEVRRDNGHVFGCGCGECRADRSRQWEEFGERRKRGESGPTLADMLLDARKKGAN